MNVFKPSEIPLISTPITSSNRRNAKNHPAVNLGCCTAFQLLDKAGVLPNGSIGIIGNPAKSITTVKALIRRSQKPYVFLGSGADSNSVFASLNPEWVLNSAHETIPNGSGAIYFKKPIEAYTCLTLYLEDWALDHVIILHVGNGLQIGGELLNVLNAIGQPIILCEAVPQSLRSSDSATVTPLQFMRQMRYLLVFSSGAETGELIELLPKYRYEKINDGMELNAFSSRSFFHPFRPHRGIGFSANQSRTLEFKKDLFEMDELQKLYNAGYMLVYNALYNTVYLAQIV